MFVAKPVPAGKVAALDGEDKMTELQNLAELAGAELIPMQEPGDSANPDGAKAGPLAPVPGVMDGAPVRAPRKSN